MPPSPSDSTLPPPDPAVAQAVAGLSASELRLEREHCALELERLALERERLETERLRLERERELYAGGGSNALHVGIGVLVLAVVVVLALGLLFGYNAGLDAGRLQAPAPRKILVNGPFLDMLRKTPPGTLGMVDTLTPPDIRSRRPWEYLNARPAADSACGNLPLLR